MKRGRMAALLAACLLLSGCAALLERDYSAVELYTDRYWDTSAEDTLRVESYQDLVNSLLMLVEQHAEEGTIRCYGEANSPYQAQAASREVRLETTLGSYLLRRITYSHEAGSGYGILRVQLDYREDAEALESVMPLSDSQSLVDLLRLTVREGREKLTVRFPYETSREEVTAAAESLWRELCLGEQAALPGPEEAELEETGPEEAGPDESASPEDPEPAAPPEGGEEAVPAGRAGETAGGAEELGEDPVPPEEPEEAAVPPCPWLIRFYPDTDAAELVEILLEPPA